MSRFIFVKTAIASLMLAGAASGWAQERPAPLYSTSTYMATGQAFAVATTTPPPSSPRSQFVVVAKASTHLQCTRQFCGLEPVLEVDAWQDTTTALAATSIAGIAVVPGGVSEVAATGLDSGRVVTADVNDSGVLTIQTWSVGTGGITLQNGYSTTAGTAAAESTFTGSPELAIATLNSTAVVTAYALPNGTLAVEEWTISAAGLPAPVSTIGYQSGDVTGNQVLPGQNGVFANDISIATVNPNQVITAIGDSSKTLWVTTWGVNGEVQAQQFQQVPNVAAPYAASVAVAAGETSVLVPGIGLRPPHYETVQNAFVPVVDSANDLNVFSWTIATTGQLTLQPAPAASCCQSIEVAATMLPTNIQITSDTGFGQQIEVFYHGDLLSGWGVELSQQDSDPPAIYKTSYGVYGPVSAAFQGNSAPSAFSSYNAYFVTASADPYTNTLYVWDFSYPLPPTTVGAL